jgi:glucose-specific phosphotransferase system IIA component
LKNKIDLLLPISGKILALSEVNDYLFEKKIIGDGAAINPNDNFVYAPLDGEIVLVYEAKHAIAIKGDSGIQVLIHIGIDSVKLEGKGFATYVKTGDRVKAGDKILFFDREYVNSKASIVSPIVVTNMELVESIDINYSASKAEDKFISVFLK